MNWQQLLIRAGISVAASAVSTGALVVTAKRGPEEEAAKEAAKEEKRVAKDREKKRKRQRQRRAENGGQRKPLTPAEERRRKRRRKKRKKERERKQEAKTKAEAEALNADPGTLAGRHLEAAQESGLEVDEFLDNLKGTGRGLKTRVGRLLGFGKSNDDVPAQGGDDELPVEREQGRGKNLKQKRRGQRRRKKQTRQDGLDALKEDVIYLAKDKVKETVKQKVADAAGVGDLGEKVATLKEAAGDIGERASDVASTLAESAKDGAGRIGDAAGTVKRSAEELAGNVLDAIPEDGVAAASEGAKGLGRWLQGPGAQDYDRTSPRLLDGTADVVEANMRSDDHAPVTTDAPGDSSDLDNVNDNATDVGDEKSTHAPPGEASPFKAPREREEAADDRWSTMEPGSRFPSAGNKSQPRASSTLVENENLSDLGHEPVRDTGLDSAQSDEIVEAKIDEDAEAPTRRHRS